MDMLLISILALVIGSLSGTGCALLYHNIKGKNNDKAISEMLEKAKKDADETRGSFRSKRRRTETENRK